MWPWEHLGFGYILYSLTSRLVDGSPPSGSEVVLVSLGTQLPDLIDKPLAWLFNVIPVSTSIGHSAVVFLPAIAIAAVGVARWDATRINLVVAYGIGHLSHLLGDIIYPVFMGEGLRPGRVLWPLVTLDGSQSEAEFFAIVAWYFHRYREQLVALEPTPLLWLQLGLTVAVIGLWIIDGKPGLSMIVRLRSRFSR